MARLQKSDRQHQRLSRPPVCANNEHSVPSKSSTTSNRKVRAMSCPPPIRSQMPEAPRKSQIGVQSNLEEPIIKSFEHSPMALEPSFVAVGREMFLRRASIISQTYANKFKANNGDATGKSRGKGHKMGQSARSSKKLDRSGAMNPREPPSSFRGFPDLSPTETSELKSVLQKSQAESVPSGKTKSDPAKHSKVRFVSRKRSQSLPTMNRSDTERSSALRLSSSTVNETQSDSCQSASSESDRLPFTPKVDLEMVFDNISATYNQKLAEAQRKSSILWKRTFLDQRSANREAGVLTKRQKRVSSPGTIGQPLAIPYNDVEPAGLPTLVGSIKGELPSNRAGPLPETHNMMSTSCLDPQASLTTKSVWANSHSNLSIDSPSVPDSYTADHKPCPNCGHKYESDKQAILYSRTTAAEDIQPIQHGKTAGQFSLQTPGPSSPLKQSGRLPGTPTEISVIERMQVTRAMIEAASTQQTLGNVMKSTSDRRASNLPSPLPSSAMPQVDPARKKTSSSSRHVSHVSYERKLDWSRIVGSVQDIETSPNVLSVAQILRQPDTEPDRGPLPHVTTHAGEQITAKRTYPENAIPQVDQTSPTHSASSSVSSFYSFASSQSQSTSLNQTNCTSAPTSQSKLSFVSVNSSENAARSPRTSSASPNRGILSIAPSIVTRTLITDIHPALRSEYALALEASTTTSYPLADSPTTTSNPELLPQALNISRSSKRSSPTMMAREPNDTHGKPVILPRTKPKQVQSRFIELELKPREGTQSLSQFQRNCRQIPQSPTAPSPSSPLPSSFEQNVATPTSLRRKPPLKDETLSRNRLQKAPPDPATDVGARGRRRSRQQQAKVSERGSSLQTTTDVLPKDSKLQSGVNLGLKTPDIDTNASPSSTADESIRAVETNKTRVSVPPNSYITQTQHRREDRSTSRGRSRIRSMLSSIRFPSREARASERVESDQDRSVIQSATTDSQLPSHSQNEVDTFRTSGPYELIGGPEIAASSSRSALRRNKEAGLTSKKATTA